MITFTKQEWPEPIREALTLAFSSAPEPRHYADAEQQDIKFHLLYTLGVCRWWISEVNKETGDAFGFACINGWVDCAEWGYIHIPELLHCGADIDPEFQPGSYDEVVKPYLEIFS